MPRNRPELGCLCRWAVRACFTPGRQWDRGTPGWRYVARGQRALTASRLAVGLFWRCGLFTELRDELIKRPRTGFGLVADGDGDLAARYASIGLAFAETPGIGNSRACECHGFRRVNLRIR